MGLKYGMAAVAAMRGLYVPLKLHGGKPFPLAKVILTFEDDPQTKRAEIKHALRYPDGTIGHLILSDQLQLEIGAQEKFPWVPTHEESLAMAGTLPASRIIFEGTHEVRDISEHLLA